MLLLLKLLGININWLEGTTANHSQYVRSSPIWQRLHQTIMFRRFLKKITNASRRSRLTFDVTFYHPIAVYTKHVVYCWCFNSALQNYNRLKQDVKDDTIIFSFTKLYVLKQPRARVRESYRTPDRGLKRWDSAFIREKTIICLMVCLIFWPYV